MLFISRKESKRIQEAIHYIAHLDKGDWQIEIKPYRKNLTAQQRKYFHQLLQIIAEHCGEDIDDLKTRMCFTLGYTKTVRLRDKTEVLVRMSTEKLTREDYSKMIQAAQMACMQLGLQFPEPCQYEL